MNEPIASVKHGINKEDIKVYYDRLLKKSQNRKISLILNAIVAVCGIAFTVLTIVTVKEEPNISVLQVFYILIIYIVLILHFVKRHLLKYIHVNKIYKGFSERKSESDHTDFFKDKLVAVKSNSKIEVAYRDITDIWDSGSVVVVTTKSYPIHIFRKENFYLGGYDDIRQYIKNHK